MKKLVFLLLSVVLVLSTVSCSQTQVYGAEAKSDKAYDNSPEVSDTTLKTLIDGNNEFAFDLYKQLSADKEGNFFYSPYSISLALAMTYAGANGQTEEQMADVLHFLLADEELHEAFNKLAIELNSRNEVPEDSDMQASNLTSSTLPGDRKTSSSCRHSWMFWLKITMPESGCWITKATPKHADKPSTNGSANRPTAKSKTSSPKVQSTK